MPTTLQCRCGPALTTAGVQDATAWGHHRIDEACLTFEIGVLSGQLSKVLGVPLGMVVLGFGEPPGSVSSEMIVRVGHEGQGTCATRCVTLCNMPTTTRKAQGSHQWANVTEAYRDGQRASIATNALALLIEGGGAGLSMSALAQEAGISRPTLYRYYPDMESVLVGVAALVAQHDESFSAQVLAESDPRGQLRAFLDAVTDPATHGHPSAVELQAALPQEGRRMVRAHEDRARGLLADILRRGVQAGDFAADIDPDTDARFILGLAQQAQADTIERVHALVDKLVQPTKRRKS